jgi:hypothetical protein
VTVPASRIAIDANSYNRTPFMCIQCIAGLGCLKLLFSEQTALRVGFKPEPIQEPVLAKCDDNNLPNAVMVRATLVNYLDFLVNLEK